MTATEQITHDFGRGENYSLLETAAGRVLITRKEYTDHFGTKRTTFKAQSLEPGVQIACKSSNPFTALISLFGYVNVGGYR